uniref:Uncharacterized protein n=1 Tax=Microcebus murinus TaxID=30608 RepID=A0A8C5Y6L7_MICMU
MWNPNAGRTEGKWKKAHKKMHNMHTAREALCPSGHSSSSSSSSSDSD